MNDNIHTLPHGHYRYRKKRQEGDIMNEKDNEEKENTSVYEENIRDIDWDEDIPIMQKDTDMNKKNNEEENTRLYENNNIQQDIDWDEDIISIMQKDADTRKNEKKNEENTINSLCMEIDWNDISIVDEKNLSPPQTTGEEEQIMLDTFSTNINFADTQLTRNIIAENNTTGKEEKADICGWFEENNVNSYDMEEAEWEIPAFPLPK